MDLLEEAYMLGRHARCPFAHMAWIKFSLIRRGLPGM